MVRAGAPLIGLVGEVDAEDMAGLVRAVRGSVDRRRDEVHIRAVGARAGVGSQGRRQGGPMVRWPSPSPRSMSRSRRRTSSPTETFGSRTPG